MLRVRPRRRAAWLLLPSLRQSASRMTACSYLVQRHPPVQEFSVTLRFLPRPYVELDVTCNPLILHGLFEIGFVLQNCFFGFSPGLVTVGGWQARGLTLRVSSYTGSEHLLLLRLCRTCAGAEGRGEGKSKREKKKGMAFAGECAYSDCFPIKTPTSVTVRASFMR